MQIEFWYWWAIALGLLAAEVFVPGIFMMWIGVGAAVTGFALLAAPDMSIESQLLICSIVSIVSVFTWRRFFYHPEKPTDHPWLNQRSAQYIGRTFTLKESIVNGIGKISVDDSQWIVYGPDMDAGQKVLVVSVSGADMLVEPA